MVVCHGGSGSARLVQLNVPNLDTLSVPLYPLTAYIMRQLKQQLWPPTTLLPTARQHQTVDAAAVQQPGQQCLCCRACARTACITTKQQAYSACVPGQDWAAAQ